jgi:uncharacterized SAM-dependent methyltransferase
MDFNNIDPANGAVIDIGGSKMRDYVKDRLMGTFKLSTNSMPVLPDELLYDDVGLPIWNRIIFNPAFYQTHDEMALFDKNGAKIAERLREKGVTLIDLGAGLVFPCQIIQTFSHPTISTHNPLL